MKSSAVLLAVLAFLGASTFAQAQTADFRRTQSNAYLQRERRQPHDARREI